MPTIDPINLESDGHAARVYKRYQERTAEFPNFYRTVAHSPAILESYIGVADKYNELELTPGLQQQVALAIAGESKSEYCIAAHVKLAQKVGVTKKEALLNAQGIATDQRTALILHFAIELLRLKGAVPPAEVNLLRGVGVSDQEIVEIISMVVMSLFSTYLNAVAGTQLDCPQVKLPPANEIAELDEMH